MSDKESVVAARMAFESIARAGGSLEDSLVAAIDTYDAHRNKHTVMEGVQDTPDVVRPAPSANPTQNPDHSYFKDCADAGMLVYDSPTKASVCTYCNGTYEEVRGNVTCPCRCLATPD